jgi:aspartate ammonia-lyase
MTTNNIISQKPKNNGLQSDFAINAINQLPNYRSNNYFYSQLTQTAIELKSSIAKANFQLGALEQAKSEAICNSVSELLNNWDTYKELFPLSVLQYAAGTTLNMNINEVIANVSKAKFGAILDPHDDVNLSQSTNDVIPTAAKICYKKLNCKLLATLNDLSDTLDTKSVEFQNLQKLGRTHLQDATGITLGEEFNSYRALVTAGIENINTNTYLFNKLPIGGTATGTKANTPSGYCETVIEIIKQDFNDPEFSLSDNLIASISNQSWISYLSGIVKSITLDLSKIAQDIRLMASGPEGGLNEIVLPVIQPGSSIMPSKINPIVPEMVLQCSAKIVGNDSTITYAMQGSNFELNPISPIMIYSLFDSIYLLILSSDTFREKCIAGITPNLEKLEQYSKSKQIKLTELAGKIGYDNVII